MSNKIIKISNYSSTTNPISEECQFEVYRDFSLAAQRKHVKTPVKTGTDITYKDQTLFFATKDVNVKAVFNSLRNIFSWIPGERILNPEFGSKLRTYLYEGITPQNKEMIVAEIRGACMKWEPRVNITDIKAVSNVDNDENNTVQIDIKFSIPSLSTKQYNYSYIYDRTN